LYAARYEHAAQLYREEIKRDPHCAAAYDGLTRALLRSHHTADAFEAADSAISQAPGQAPALAAQGRALFRKGDIAGAEKAWKAAATADPKSAAAIQGLARIQSLLSQAKLAQTYRGMAHRLAPDDPDLMLADALGLHGPAHIAALRSALAIYDPDSREAKRLRAHIASDEAAGDLQTGKLKSGYHAYELKLMAINDGPHRFRGLGLRVSFNGEHPATLLLDTGSSGISIAPRLAEKVGLKQLGSDASEVGGIGSGDKRDLFRYVAASVVIGDVEFQDYPLSVFDTAKSPDFDGLIGADVFARFLVTIDFPNHLLNLAPFAQDPTPGVDDPPKDGQSLPPGFFRVFRLSHMLLVPSFVNKDPAPHLFLIDSGSSSNLIDPTAARGSTKTYSDSRTTVKGLQGVVKNVSRADEATLFFAGFRQKNPDLLAVDLSSQSDDLGIALDGILGMPVLNNLKMTIDYRDGGLHPQSRPIPAAIRGRPL
jgi:predicted aspartyl protease